MADDAAPITIEHGGMTLQSVGVSEADAKASMENATPDESKGSEKPEKDTKPEKPKKLSLSDHGRELGKRGGKAAAEKRAEEKPEKPERSAPETRAQDPGPTEVDDDDSEAGDEELTRRQRRRVEVATRKQAETRRELDRERAERAQERSRYEAELAAHRVQAPRAEERQPERAQPRDPEGKPREEDFERFSDYLDAREEYARRQWEQEHERRAHAEGQVREVRGYVDEFLKHVGKDILEELDPELADMKPIWFLGDDEPVRVENLIATELLYLRDKAPAVLRYLSKHPQEIERLKSLRSHPDVRLEVQILARTIGSRADATTGNPPASGERASKPSISRANPPVKPVSGAPHVADGEVYREGMSFDEYYESDRKRRTAQR